MSDVVCQARLPHSLVPSFPRHLVQLPNSFRMFVQGFTGIAHACALRGRPPKSAVRGRQCVKGRARRSEGSEESEESNPHLHSMQIVLSRGAAPRSRGPHHRTVGEGGARSLTDRGVGWGCREIWSITTPRFSPDSIVATRLSIGVGRNELGR